MKTYIKFLTVTYIVLFASMNIISCERSNSDSDEETPPAATGFFWRENDMNATQKTAGSSELRTQYKSIFAFTGNSSTSGTVFEINLTGTAAATYDLSTTGNALYFNGFGTATAGKVIIIKNDGSKASGTFEATGTGGTVSKVYGTFTDITVN